jgi:hypothetical protein
MIPIIEVLQVSKMHVFLVSEVFLRNVQRNSLTVEAFIELLYNIRTQVLQDNRTQK